MTPEANLPHVDSIMSESNVYLMQQCRAITCRGNSLSRYQQEGQYNALHPYHSTAKHESRNPLLCRGHFRPFFQSLRTPFLSFSRRVYSCWRRVNFIDNSASSNFLSTNSCPQQGTVVTGFAKSTCHPIALLTQTTSGEEDKPRRSNPVMHIRTYKDARKTQHVHTWQV